MKETRSSQGAEKVRAKRDDFDPGRDTLAADVAEFASQLLEKYAQRFRRRPVAIKKRILKLLATRLPPYPRRAGRKPSENVTRASRLYAQQRREKAHGKRRQIDWRGIALRCSPAFKRARSNARRSQVLRSLQSAVYARQKRTSRRRVRRTNKRSRTIHLLRNGALSEQEADASNSEPKES